ncbi:MAG TPA: ribosome maturation factor RimM [Gemmatimonadaceae bacterium]|nr:ribosome maturation factor RimM [Gemmatimonadaceae bacterium]
MPAPDARDLVIVGRLRRAHGVKGDLIAEAITDTPAAIFAAGRVLFAGTPKGDPDPKGRTLTIARSAERFDGSWLLAFSEVADRDDAARWRARYLLVPRAELAPLAAGDVYVHELHGMRVALEDGTELGDVRDVFELPAGLALDVGYKTGTVLLPYAFVRAVDRAARRITAAPPDGLFE